MTEIRDWTGGLTAIDTAYGYDDRIILVDDGGPLAETNVLGLLERPPDIYAGNGLPASGEGRFVASEQAVRQEMARIGGQVQPTDQIFRFSQDDRTYFILRRSLHTDRCTTASQPALQLPASMVPESLARALSFFGGSQQSDPIGDHWCRQPVQGGEDLAELPWNLTEDSNLKSLRRTIEIVRAARSGTIPDHVPSAAEAPTIANAVSPDDLTRLEEWIEHRITANMNPIERFMHQLHQQPWYVYVPADAVGFVVGTAIVAAIFHYVSEFLRKPPPPPSGGPGIPDLIEEMRGLRDQLRQPTGEPVRTPAPEVIEGTRSAFQSSETGWWSLAAIAAGAGVLLLMRGRLREGEVRAGELDGVRARELGIRATELRTAPTTTIRGGEVGGGRGRGSAFDLLGPQPVLAQ